MRSIFKEQHNQQQQPQSTTMPSSRSLRAEQALPNHGKSYYSSSGRSNNRMMLETADVASVSSSTAGLATTTPSSSGAASRRRNLAFLKYGSDGLPKKSASNLQKSREHARQIANITPTPWDTTSSSDQHAHAANSGSGEDLFSHDFLAAKIQAAQMSTSSSSFAPTFASSTATGSASHHHKKSSSSSRREKSKSGSSSSNRNVASNSNTNNAHGFASTDAFADFGAAFAAPSQAQPQHHQQPQQQKQHQQQQHMISDLDSSFHSETSSSLSFFDEDPFANVRSSNDDAFTTNHHRISSNNLQQATRSSHQQQQQQQLSVSSSSNSNSSRRGGAGNNTTTTMASTRAAQNTRENKNHLDNAFTSSSRQQQQQPPPPPPASSTTTMIPQDWSAHSASQPQPATRRNPQQPPQNVTSPAGAAAASSPRTSMLSMSTMPSNSSMQRAFVNHQQLQQHQQQQQQEGGGGGSVMSGSSSSAMARRKMRSQQKGGMSSTGSITSQTEPQPPSISRTPPQSPYSQGNNNRSQQQQHHRRHPSSSSETSAAQQQPQQQQPQRVGQQQYQQQISTRSISSNNTGRSDSTAATSAANGGGGGGGGSNGSVGNLFSPPGHHQHGGAGFTFDAFGLDATQMNAQLNQAMHELAGSHPDLSFFVDDDFATSSTGGAGQHQAWDYASQSPPLSRSSTPPPPGATTNKQGTTTIRAANDNMNSASDLDDEEGFVDGFRITKQSHLPVHIRNSPCSTERSSLTSESSANHHQNANSNVNVFKEKAAFHTSKRPRKFVRPSERVDEATSPKSKQSLGSPQRHAAAAHHSHFQSSPYQHATAASSSLSPSAMATAAIQKRQEGFQQPTHLPSMPDLNNNNSSHSNSSRLVMTTTRGTINNNATTAVPTMSAPSNIEPPRQHRSRRDDVQFVDVNSDSDFSAGGGSGVNTSNNSKTVAATLLRSARGSDAATPPRGGAAGGTSSSSSNSPVPPGGSRGKNPAETVSAASRMTSRMSSTSPVRTVASLRLNAASAAALLPNHPQHQQRKPEHPSSLGEEEDEWSQTQEPHEEHQKSSTEASNRARSEVNVSASSRGAYSNMDDAAASRRAYSDVNGTAGSIRAYSEINGAASDFAGSNIPSDVGLASDVGPPPSSVGAAFENIPKAVVSRDRQPKKGSADTATTETSSLMPYEEKKEEEPITTPRTPEKSVGRLRARWEKQESTNTIDSKPSTPRTSPSFRQQQQQQQSQRNQQQQPPPPLNREHIEKLQNQLREESMSPQSADQRHRPDLSYRPAGQSPHIRRAQERAQQQPPFFSGHRVSNGNERPAFYQQQQQQRLSPSQYQSPSSPQQRYGAQNASKSEGGAAHTRFRPAHISSAINKIQSPQSSIGTPRDARSDTGAPSPSFFNVKLRKTGNIQGESPTNNDNYSDPTSSYKPPLSPKPSYQYSKQSPPPSPKTPYQYSRQQSPPVSPAISSRSRPESPSPASPRAGVPLERKMSYRERRELEIQKKRDEELRQQEKEQETAPPDVASLIKRRIAANKRTGDTSTTVLSSPRDLPPRHQPIQIPSPRQPSAVELPPKPYYRQSSQRELSSEPVAREHSPDRYASEPSPGPYTRNEMKDSLSKILTERQSTAPQRSRSRDFEHSDSRDLSIEEVGPTQNESLEPSAAISRLLMLQQLQARIPAEPTTGRQTDALSRQDSEDHYHRSSTPKATKMMLNAFLAGRDSIASADGISYADTLGEGHSDEKSAGPLSALPALKDDPQYERYFKMLKLGMPIEVVKHAMIRDGLDPAIMDGDPNKPVMVGIPLREDPTYQKYFKMLKIGMPMEAVKHAMLRDGLDCSVMDQDHNLPIQKAKSEDDHDEPKEKDSHRRARLHWKTLRKVTSNSLWAKLDQEVSFQDIDIDEDEFQQLFQAERGEAPAPKASSTSVGGRGVHVRVIDPKRANNGGIILARLKMSHDDMADAVDRINEQALTAEQIEHIIEFLPSKEERKALESYMLEGGQDAAEKFDGLCECEKFMVSMMTVKHAKRKVRALLFKLQFENCLDDILQDTLAVEAACDELSNSIRLRQLLGIILTFGNRLNTAGNKKRRAGAFTLDSLLKLNQAKAFDKKTTFLHYIILIVQRNNELLLRFKDDLPTVFKADKVFWDQCLSDLEEVESQLENVRKIALHQARQSHCYRLRRRKQRDDDGSESLSDDEVSLSLEEEVEALRATPIGTFTLNAIKYASSLRDKVEETQGKLSRLLEYFGEEDKNMGSHELFSIIVNFSRDFDKAKEQVFSNEKRKMREERKHKSTRGKPPTHSPGPPLERKMLKASSHQPTISGALRGIQTATEPPSDVSKNDPYSYRSSGVDSSQLPVIEDNIYHAYNHPNSIMETSSQNSATGEDEDRLLDAPDEKHVPLQNDRYIVSDQQRRFQAASTSADIEQKRVDQDEPRSHTPVSTRPGPDAPLTPAGYHRVDTPKSSRIRSDTPNEDPKALDRSSPAFIRQQYTVPEEEELKTLQNSQEEEEGKSVGRSSPSVCSTGSARKAGLREKARMRRRRQSANQSVQSPAPVAEDSSGLERDLSPDPSDTISQSSAISSTLSPRSTFRHRRRLEVRERLRQEN